MSRVENTTAVSFAFLLASVFRLSICVAQTTSPITSSGLNTEVNLSATPPPGTVQYDITGGTRAGTNLFHSFGDFNIPTHSIANFLNDSGLSTSNILGRVTGGNPSSIFGTIQTTGFGDTNLFLMNPAGIVFGPTASLNVGGSVAFTTADYLRLTDNGRFTARPNTTADTLLSSAPVISYGFLGSLPGAISVQGSRLNVPEGQGISLIGGNITIQNGMAANGTTQSAHLSAPTGHINLASTKSPGELRQDFTAVPNINDTSFRSYGSAQFTPGSVVDLTKTGNGAISIRGGQFILGVQNAVLDTQDSPPTTPVTANQDTIRLAPGSSIVSRTFSTDRGPDIQVVADHLQFIGDADPLSQTQAGVPVNVLARTNGSGDAGNVTLRTSGNLELINFVQIDSSSGLTPDGTAPSAVLALGNAGNVDLTSTHGNISMSGFGTMATSQTGNSTGTTGIVTASAPGGEILLDGANLFTLSSSNGHGGGNVTVIARNLLMKNFGLISTDNESQFKQGGITITLSNNLEVSSGSVITAFSVSSAPAGDITLTAKNIVVTQGSIINNAGFASGAGGQLKIITDTLHVTDGAQLSSGSTRAPTRGRLLDILGDIKPSGSGGDVTVHAAGSQGSILIDGVGSGIFADTEGTGSGGTINLSAQTVTIQDGGTISASTTGTAPTAIGGSIFITTTDRVMLTNGGSITVSSVIIPDTPHSGVANAGNISINAGRQLELRDHSSITATTQSAQANGGNIDIQAIERVRLLNSEISTSVNGATGNGGNISIDPNAVVLQNSQIVAQAVAGHGGNITITTPLFLADQLSLIDASSQFGLNGSVTIQSPISNLSGTIGQLASKPSPIQTLIQNRCAALADGPQSTFIVNGRQTFPTMPGGWLSSPTLMPGEMLGVRSEERARGLFSASNDKFSLRRLTPSGFLVRSFANEGPTGCRL